MKNKGEFLLNEQSIKEVFSILNTIDEQIIDLQKCSSEDFLGLNSDFKIYYNQSKGISNNANEIFKSLSEIKNRNLFLELQSLYKDLKKIQGEYNQSLNQSTQSLKSIQTFLDQFFIPIKNLKQNLSTLKFLLANLTLNDSEHLIQADKKWDNLVRETKLLIDEYHEKCLICEKNIFNLESETVITLKGFESVLISNANDLDSILNNIHYGIIFFAEKHEEVKNHIPELTTKTENNSQNISDIITNLQYQDIIRQKIEHIQLSHQSILKEFDQLYQEGTFNAKKQSQLFQKIKDISGLQAAILVKANKEYQLAIEKITEKFIEIGNEMISITAICKKLNNIQDNSEEIYLAGVLQKLYNSEQIFTNFIDSSKKHSLQIENLNTFLFQTTNSINSLADSSTKFRKSSDSIISHFSLKAIDDSCLKNIVSQIKEVLVDIHQFEGAIQLVLAEILKNEINLKIEIKLLINSILKNQTVNNAAASIKSVLSQLQVISDQISHLLEENISQSNSTILEIKESIKRIRYYDLSEKTISSIILELNTIHQKLIGVELDDTLRDENLNSIKDSYTMESEHRIHERIISNDQNDSINFDQTLNENNGRINSDEIELF